MGLILCSICAELDFSNVVNMQQSLFMSNFKLWGTSIQSNRTSICQGLNLQNIHKMDYSLENGTAFYIQTSNLFNISSFHFKKFQFNCSEYFNSYVYQIELLISVADTMAVIVQWLVLLVVAETTQVRILVTAEAVKSLSWHGQCGIFTKGGVAPYYRECIQCTL